MKYNPKPFERRLKLYLARQEKAIEELINISIAELVRRTTLVDAPSDRDFFFRDYPALSKMVDNVLGRLSGELTGMIQTGIEWSWELANAKNDDMVSRILRSIGVGRVPAEALARWNQKNLPALEAFERRRIGGMGLSDKVWAYTKGIKGDLELALDLGIGEGMSAGRLSRTVRQYLREPDRLYRRVRDEKGILRLSKSASNYHPGQGVYRSSYKNAKRLATTETNMAYRSADCERARQIDFILGIEIHLSKNHTCLDAHGVPQPFYDICDELQGRYPKDFIFKGWHPNCYDEETEVYTSRGWVRFADVIPSDQILTLNPETLDLEWSDYLLKITSWYEGPMIHFHNRSLDYLVTPDHEVLCLEKNSREPVFKRIKASKCGKSQPIYRSSEWVGKHIDSVLVGSNSVPFGRFCEFMGYWLADGSLGHKWEVGIAQQDDNKENIYACIEAMGMHPRYNAGKVEFNSRDWYTYLQQFGKCADKFVPEEIKRAEPEQIKVFLNAFISCDGHIKEPHSFIGNRGIACAPKEGERTYFTTSKRMADDIGELILKIGRRPSFRLNKIKGKECLFNNGVYVNNYDCWVISECRSKTATQYYKETVGYKGYVYDLTLAKNATMYIRRNGKCFWGSNCRCYMTTILPDQDEFVKYLAAMDENGHSTYPLGEGVTELPENFKKWMSENQNRIALAEQRGQLPYFITDNRELIERDVYLNPQDRYAPMTAKDLQYLASQGIISEGSIGVLGSMKSDMLRQAQVSRLVTTHAGFDIDTYARIYGAKNPKVAELYQEIGILRGKDEVLRLRKINELKTICGNLSAKEIQKWGLASGLEYVGVDRNVVFEKAGSRFVNGKVIDIKELRKDLLIFRSSGSNVVFNYPLGIRKADAVYDLGEAAKFVGGLPAYLTSGISSIRFINQRNPFDKYWAAYYKLRSFESYATDGEHITFWRQTKTKPAFFQYALTHETAHIYDFAHDITKSDKWKQAIEADIALFKANKIASDFPTPYARQAYRAADNIREDFADSLAKKLEYDKKYGSKWFSRLFPNRAKLLAELLAKWPK